MKAVLTGGGTSGHVTPNIALFKPLKEAGFELYYIGTEKGIESSLVRAEQIPFYPIEAGKLRRYLDMENIKDISRILKGYREARKILKDIKPDVVFSKGGFVSCPVVWAAKSLRIPVVLHESDITPGLANKLCLPCAKKICFAFPETQKYLPEGKSIYTGLPVRDELLKGDRNNGLKLLEFDGIKPILTIMGGSQGSEFLNTLVRGSLAKLLEKFDICHLCGKGKADENLLNIKGYCQFEYLNRELKDVLAASDIMVSRAGATSIFETAALGRPLFLVPLSRRASRGDQILNAKSFKKMGLCDYAEEEELSTDNFAERINKVYDNRGVYTANQRNNIKSDSISETVNIIKETAKGKK